MKIAKERSAWKKGQPKSRSPNDNLHLAFSIDVTHDCAAVSWCVCVWMLLAICVLRILRIAIIISFRLHAKRCKLASPQQVSSCGLLQL